MEKTEKSEIERIERSIQNTKELIASAYRLEKSFTIESFDRVVRDYKLYLNRLEEERDSYIKAQNPRKD